MDRLSKQDVRNLLKSFVSGRKTTKTSSNQPFFSSSLKDNRHENFLNKIKPVNRLSVNNHFRSYNILSSQSVQSSKVTRKKRSLIKTETKTINEINSIPSQYPVVTPATQLANISGLVIAYARDGFVWTSTNHLPSNYFVQAVQHNAEQIPSTSQDQVIEVHKGQLQLRSATAEEQQKWSSGLQQSHNLNKNLARQTAELGRQMTSFGFNSNPYNSFPSFTLLPVFSKIFLRNFDFR